MGLLCIVSVNSIIQVKFLSSSIFMAYHIDNYYLSSGTLWVPSHIIEMAIRWLNWQNDNALLLAETNLTCVCLYVLKIYEPIKLVSSLYFSQNF